MTIAQAMLDASRARSRFNTASSEVSSGLRVQHAEDAPAAAASIAQSVEQAIQLKSVEEAMTRAASDLGSMDVALDGVSNTLSRARELAVQMSNGSYSAADRAAASVEVAGLTKQLIGLLNTQSGGRYLFGGFRDDAAPYDAAGTYQGDTGVRQIEVAPGLLSDASVRIDVAVSGVGGGTDVLATLQALSTALSTNNVVGVQATLDGLDQGIGQVAQVRSEAGGHQAVLDVALAATQAARVDVDQRQGALADADLIGAATRLAQAEQALNASLTATAKTFGPSLLDKL